MASAADLLLLPNAAVVRTLNHLLAGQPWLRERLVPHAGRSCRVEVFPFGLTLLVGMDGSLLLPGGPVEPEAHIRMTPATLARVLSGDEAARQHVQVSGDAAFAGALATTLQALRWDAEEDLSRVVGDVAAHRIVQGAQGLAAWPRAALQGVSASVAEYLVEERPLLARKEDVARFNQEVDALRDAVERLEKRIERMAAARA
jgi:ubiquinone biosynthesis protein UbiJ